jgi:hypothetical protein
VSCPGVASRRVPLVTGLLLSALLVACAYYSGLIPNLRCEDFNIARSIVAGEGFANPFRSGPTGPTAWAAPAYPMIMVTLLTLGHGSEPFVGTGIVVLHVIVLCLSGLLVLALARQTTTRIGSAAAAAIFFLALCFHFSSWFQYALDCWLVLLDLDLLIAGFCWLRPVDSWPRAILWGLAGGLIALINPIVGFIWGVLMLALGLRRRRWGHAALAIVLAGVVLTPWTVRNYLVLGRLMPVKSNFAYEMYQSLRLQPGGLLKNGIYNYHPGSPRSEEGRAFRALGEGPYMQRKTQEVWQAVWAEPLDFLDGVSARFLAATVWYVPFNQANQVFRVWPEPIQPTWALCARYLTQPLPFLALLFLIWTARRHPLSWPQWVVIGTYLLYLLPYLVASFYERYAIPLVVVKTLLVIWAADRLLAFWPRAVAQTENKAATGLVEALPT